MVEKGANVNNSENKWGMTPLHYIALYDQKGWTDADNLSNSRNCVCIFKKTSVNRLMLKWDNRKNIFSQLEYLELLIDHGADVQAKDKSHRTPFDLARSQKGGKIVNFFHYH